MSAAQRPKSLFHNLLPVKSRSNSPTGVIDFILALARLSLK